MLQLLPTCELIIVAQLKLTWVVGQVKLEIKTSRAARIHVDQPFALHLPGIIDKCIAADV